MSDEWFNIIRYLDGCVVCHIEYGGSVGRYAIFDVDDFNGELRRERQAMKLSEYKKKKMSEDAEFAAEYEKEKMTEKLTVEKKVFDVLQKNNLDLMDKLDRLKMENYILRLYLAEIAVGVGREGLEYTRESMMGMAKEALKGE